VLVRAGADLASAPAERVAVDDVPAGVTVSAGVTEARRA
jgi:hypothetical protein